MEFLFSLTVHHANNIGNRFSQSSSLGPTSYMHGDHRSPMVPLGCIYDVYETPCGPGLVWGRFTRFTRESSKSSVVSGKTRPPSDPEADLRGQPTPTPRRPDPTPWPKTESRRVTLECQTVSHTLKVRETVRRISSLTSQSFVIRLY